jgi:penicillin-binding protein 1B
MKKLWFLAKLLAVIAVLGTVGLLYYFHGIDKLISEKFDRPKKWDLPSRVYSDAEYFYPGASIKDRQIIAKLDRLGYRDTGNRIIGPGDYASGADFLEIYLHDFDYPDEKLTGFPVRMEIANDTITSMINMTNKSELMLVKLEPEEIASIFDDKMEDRTIITLADVPKSLAEAIIAIEDERFLEHSGVDPIGILRAALVNLKSMSLAQGGSTLTQQLVKNFFLYPKKSIIRKLNEAIIAYRIEKAHSKAEILEAYLNQIYLGQRGASSVSGVAEASKLYFAKNVDQLTIGESALLAGMIKNPSRFNPVRNPQVAKERRNFVLSRMHENGLISKSQHDLALAEEIITPKTRVRFQSAPFFVDFVKRQLADFYPPQVLKTEGMRIFTTLDMLAQIAAEDAVREGINELEKTYANLLPKDHPYPLEACLIAMQPSTGYVRALVGGRDYGASQFDRCTQAMRQPGSTFKPFVYLAAFDPTRGNGVYTASTLIDDSSFEVESGGDKWSPKNYDKKEHGRVTLRRALENSYNIATARLAIDVGLDEIVKTAADAGITSSMLAVPSMALGSFEVTPIEMAGAYTVFPNGGIRSFPLAIITVVTKEGEILERKSLRMKRAFGSAPAYITTNIMKGVMDRGTGAGARSMGYKAIAAGKTGTTSNYRDAWFVGFTPKILALSWVGYDDNTTTNMSGGRAALPIWTRFMQKAEPEGSGDFAGPEDVVLLKVDPTTGGLVSGRCPDGIYEAFIEGSEPEKTCEEIDIYRSQSGSYQEF